jgi:glutamine synthetase
MQREQIIFVGTSDYSAHFRGKSFIAADLPSRLERGVGLAPTNLFFSAFGPIQATPFGTAGEVFLVPDPATRVLVPLDEASSEHFYIGDIRTADGRPWPFCPRHVLRRALERFEAELQLRLLATFEQEFIYSGVPAHPLQPYELDAYRRQGAFGATLLGALRQAGVVPDSFLSEYGPQQFEVTVEPSMGLRAADDAVITRELTQAVATRLGQRVSFTPLPTPDGTSSGTHVHWSFVDTEGRAALYEPGQPWDLSLAGRQFIAGVLHHLPALCAVTAPSVVSYYRLRPNRWAPMKADAAVLDRGTAIRVCPATVGDPDARARRMNVEFRVADATASPYLVLAMLVQAGLDGIRNGRTVDADHPHSLPTSLGAALDLFEASDNAAGWLGQDLHAAYVKFKRAELRSLEGCDEAEVCRRYAEVY